MSQPTAHLLALADFNDARLDEDERIAQQAAALQDDPENGWGIVDDSSYAQPGKRRTIAPNIGITHEPESAEHIVRFNPARTLKEIRAKRTLIANWRALILRVEAEADPEKRAHLALTRHGLDQVAHQLAAVHSDHADYKESWRP
jgi:hypothetical protein